MPYNTSKLVQEVRLYLGDVTTEKLPESVITHYGDLHDSNPNYTGKYEYILWKTTLSCIDYIRASATTSSTSSSAKYSRKEKVGDVEVTVTEDNTSGGSTTSALDSLYDEYENSPEKFGVILTSTTGPILTGTNYPNLALGKSTVVLSRGTTVYTPRYW